MPVSARRFCRSTRSRRRLFGCFQEFVRDATGLRISAQASQGPLRAAAVVRQAVSDRKQVRRWPARVACRALANWSRRSRTAPSG
jgi:hypothetical protein